MRNKLRVQGVLALTRSIGDVQYKSYIINEPETQSYQLSPQDDLLILSSDGLFNCFTKESVVRKVLRLRSAGLSTGDISDTICEYAVN